MRIFSFFFLLVLINFSAYSQKNPVIDAGKFPSLPLPETGKTVKEILEQGDKYYKQGLYEAALPYYMELFRLVDNHSPLNYKIGISNLYGHNPKNALKYLEQAAPLVASDYYRQKGIALIYQNQYAEAKETFSQYLESLSPIQRKKVTKEINRFIDICNFSEIAIRDSLQVYIENLGDKVNSHYNDYNAVVVTQPTTQLFFTSRRPKGKDRGLTDRSEHKEQVLYSTEFINGKASEAMPSSVGTEKYISVAGANNSEGTLFYYQSKKRFGDIYRVRFRRNGRTSVAQRLTNNINSKTAKETNISFADNGDAYFISDRRGGEGGKDIWYAQKSGKRSYKTAKNLGSVINTPATEESVEVSPDGNTLYFSSNGRAGFGGFDLYKTQKTPDGNWSEPVNMGYPINSPDDDLFYHITPDDNIALLSSNRSGGMGGLDIYVIKDDLYVVEDDLRIPFKLFGNVTDSVSGKSIAANIALFSRENNLLIVTVTNDTLYNGYVLEVEDGGDYYIQAEADGYYTVKEDFASPDTPHAQIEKNFALKKLIQPSTFTEYTIEIEKQDSIPNVEDVETEPVPTPVEITPEPVVEEVIPDIPLPQDTAPKNLESPKIPVDTKPIENILFKTGSAVIRTQWIPELKRLINILNNNADIRIEISGHADKTGSEAVNKRLSLKRALSVEKYLLTHGISSERIKSEGYSFDYPVAPNDTEEGRTLNRRVEIEMLP